LSISDEVPGAGRFCLNEVLCGRMVEPAASLYCRKGLERLAACSTGRDLMLLLGAMISRAEVVFAFLSPVGIHALGNRVAVDTEGFGGVGNSFLVTSESLLNVELFELCQGLIEHDVAVQHLFNHSF